MKIQGIAGPVCGSTSNRAYRSALLAVGFLALTRGGWAQNQAIDPVNVAGQGRGTPAAAAPATGAPATPLVPTAAAPAASPAAGAATQAVVPVDVSPQPATPAAVVPAAPATVPVASPTTPVTASGAPVAQAAPPAATPATPGTPVATPATAATSLPAMPANPGPALAMDGKAYPVTEILVQFKFPHPSLPAESELLNSMIKLGVVNDGYVMPRADVPVVSIRLADVGKTGPQKVYHSGVAAIYSHLLRLMNSRGIIGVFVVVDPADIKMDPSNPEADEDIRKDRTSLKFEVVTSVVKAVRTVALGDIGSTNRVDNPTHEFIRDHSPLQPAVEGATQRNDLLRKDVLDDYVLRLNRFTGRHVDVAISGIENKPGQLNLDYLVTENRPWYAFAQVSNTGTSQTADIRERFGYVNNELTGHDDILTLDYSTANFTKSQAILASYDLPFLNLERVRYKMYGSWSIYTASDVGQNSQTFDGAGWSWGNDLTMNFFQKRELFIDAIAGVKVEEASSTSETGKGYGLFVEPYLGFQLERITDLATTIGEVKVVGFLSNTDEQKIQGLGTTDPSSNPVVLQYDMMHSFFLEPILEPRKFSDGKSTLAHELFFSARGQWAFNSRLFPEAQDVAGGLYSVRGYPESIAAGDTVVIGTAEYRYHVPRAFKVIDDPSKSPKFSWDKNFRFAPQTVYGRPDWDLILRAFMDAAQVNVSSKKAFENNQTMVGTGIGMEFQYKQNFNLRIDWGVPLTTLEDQVRAGTSRLHISATILY